MDTLGIKLKYRQLLLFSFENPVAEGGKSLFDRREFDLPSVFAYFWSNAKSKATVLSIIYAVLLSLFLYQSVDAQRIVQDFDADWNFYFASDVSKNITKTPVTLPHTWNADEVMSGKPYTRTVGNYEKKVIFPNAYRDKRLFLRFEGVNSVANVLVNQKFVGKHTGGYTAFCLEITDWVKLGEENLITVQASNAYNLEVLPLSGDFNVYGGIHRPVSLIITGKSNITPLDFAASGVYLIQKKVSDQSAEIEVLTKLSLQNPDNLAVKTTLRDAKGVIIAEKSQSVQADEVRQNFTLTQPHLWQGKADPYLYQVTVQLLANHQLVDEVVESLGLRYFHLDAEKGFFLNGKYLDLYGFCRHEDVQGKGSALHKTDHERDMTLIQQSGATALRLTHYPHSEYFYKLCDTNGLIVWTEIPLAGPGGYTWTGYVKNPATEANARQALQEMIRQHFNHPSIVFWGLFNELRLDFDDPMPFLRELNELAKQEDPTRLTTCATFLENDTYNTVSDAIGWNKYYGWYGGNPAQMEIWADEIHQKFPQKAICVSEYGAGASIQHHQEEAKPVVPASRFHPEEWQTAFHEGNWQALQKRPFIWGKFIWLLADFGSYIRSEGDTLGINDKGLLTYDKQTPKDAFYFYQANWTDTPLVYLTEKRNKVRHKSLTDIKVYTNLPEAELFVNGKSIGKKGKDDLRRVVWNQVPLQKGMNKISVKAYHKKQLLQDEAEWELK